MIISFGHEHGVPTRAAKVFDIRDLSHDTDSPAFVGRMYEIVEYAKAHPGATVAIGCEKGAHRARVMANQVATRARTSVMHRDI